MGSRFQRRAVFDHATFQHDVVETTSLGDLVDLPRHGNIRLTMFDGAYVGSGGEVLLIQPKDALNWGIERVSFLNASLDRFNFQDVEWGTYRNRRAIVEEALMRRGLTHVRAEQVRQIYSRLRRNHERALRYAEAGDFFIGEMEMRRKWLKSRGWRGLFEQFLLWAFSALSNYGESISRPALFWSPFIILFFAVLRIVMKEPHSLTDPRPYCWQSWQDSIWRSVGAFFQLQSPDFPMDIVERIISLPVLGVLFIAMKRKLERKS